MLVDYREGFFFSQWLNFDTDAQIHKVCTQQDTAKLAERHALAQAKTDSNCHVIKMTDNSRL